LSWTRKFKQIAKLNGYSEETSIVVFQNWLTGDADVWAIDVIVDGTASKWDMKTWLENLQLKFPYIVQKSVHTYEDLLNFSFVEFKSIPELNIAFQRMCTCIAAGERLNKLAYINCLSRFRPSVAQAINIHDMVNDLSLNDCYKYAINYEAKDISGITQKVSTSQKKEDVKDTQMEILIQKFDNLVMKLGFYQSMMESIFQDYLMDFLVIYLDELGMGGS
jgi:hypothetical protein